MFDSYPQANTSYIEGKEDLRFRLFCLFLCENDGMVNVTFDKSHIPNCN